MRGQKQLNKGMHHLAGSGADKPNYPRTVTFSRGKKLRKLRLKRGDRH